MSGDGAAAVVADRHAEVLARAPRWARSRGRTAAARPSRRRSAPGRRTPPVSPLAFAHWISRDGRVDVVEHDLGDAGPAPGASAQKSASQRLWARRPAQRRSRSPSVAPGGWHERGTFSGRTAARCWGTPPRRPPPSGSISRIRRVAVEVAVVVGAEQVGEWIDEGLRPVVEVIVVRAARGSRDTSAMSAPA